jgi:two-component system vancomycin resistance associated response regulator VraR
MERTMDGESVYPDDSPVVKIGQADSSQFTQRELQVLQVVTTGASNSVVAEKLGLSENTVKSHIRSMIEKTGCANRTELAIKARVIGIAISSDETE